PEFFGGCTRMRAVEGNGVAVEEG
ncbi:hypothetical protein A2U01_0082185, partial [Trifolium medium]|nr:hypothetical protein [Trifolium medium]